MIAADGTLDISFSQSTTTYYEYEGFTFGSLSTSDNYDFVPVTLEAGSAYTFLSTGSYQMDIELFDSQGYLLLSTDGDSIGLYDSYPNDSIITFLPDSTGTYYVMVFFAYGDYSGSWGLGVARDVGNDLTNSLLTPAAPTPSFSIVSGTDGADALAGASTADEMRGYFGDDTLSGGSGSDIIYGNQGVDRLVGGAGDDTIFGGQNGGALSGTPAVYRSGTEYLSGDSGNDVMYGNYGTDVVNGNDGNDKLYGGQDNDTLSGSTGNDTIYGNREDDLMYGGDGADLFVNAHGNDTVADFSYAAGDRIGLLSNLSSVSEASGGALITFQDGSSIQLIGVSSSSLSPSYFV